MGYVHMKLDGETLKDSKQFFEKFNEIMKDENCGVLFGCKSAQRAKYLALIYAKEIRNLDLDYKTEVESIKNETFKKDIIKRFNLE
jgi:hypothetical protein